MSGDFFLPNFFEGAADRSERLISCLQLCSETSEGRSPWNLRSGNELYRLVDKGLLYREMWPNFCNEGLSACVDTILTNFSEFSGRLSRVENMIEVKRAPADVTVAFSDIIGNLKNFGTTNHTNLYVFACIGDDLRVIFIEGSVIKGVLTVNNDVTFFNEPEEGSLPELLLNATEYEEAIVVDISIVVVIPAKSTHLKDLLDGNLLTMRKNQKAASILWLRECALGADQKTNEGVEEPSEHIFIRPELRGSDELLMRSQDVDKLTHEEEQLYTHLKSENDPLLNELLKSIEGENINDYARRATQAVNGFLLERLYEQAGLENVENESATAVIDGEIHVTPVPINTDVSNLEYSKVDAPTGLEQEEAAISTPLKPTPGRCVNIDPSERLPSSSPISKLSSNPLSEKNALIWPSCSPLRILPGSGNSTFNRSESDLGGVKRRVGIDLALQRSAIEKEHSGKIYFIY